MTDKQFDILMIYYGMLGEGSSKFAAVSYLIWMGEHTDDITWLLHHLMDSEKARAHVEETA